MSNPRRGAHIHPPPVGDAEIGLDVGETMSDLAAEGFFDKTRIAVAGIDSDGVPMSPSINGGTMRRRPGLDEDDDRDTEPDGWVMPEWD